MYRDDNMELFVLVLELVGTAAFAVSGAVVGLKKKMDVFGVCVLGITAACGGGLIRDVILGKLPPVMFSEPVYALLAALVSAVIFLLRYFHKIEAESERMQAVLRRADAAGLGIFTVSGMAACFQAGYGSNAFFTIFLGVITGVGGGLMRDIMAQSPPYIFVKHVYACASIGGAVAAYFLWDVIGTNGAMLAGTVIIVVIRELAAHYEWSLPKVK